jgi:cell wall-associated NlpC family hydrolase
MGVMPDVRLDPRVNAYRPDLADARLRGRVKASRYATGTLKRVVVPSAPLRSVPRREAPFDSELLCGEIFRVFGDTEDGWSWGQCETDDYVGYVRLDRLGPLAPEPTHRISALRTFVYPGPDMKLPPAAALSIGSRIALAGEVETRGTVFRMLAGGERAIVAAHVEPIDAAQARDFVAVAETFLHVPYLWGGRTSLGIDCSALVQLSLMVAGVSAPRDTDMQLASLGIVLEEGLGAALRRGDLVFWPGHVAIVGAPDRIVHASGHHMAVVSEPLTDATARIAAVKGSAVTVKRLQTSPAPNLGQ